MFGVWAGVFIATWAFLKEPGSGRVGEYDANWPAFAAGALVVSTPVMALFYVLQRHLVAGLTAGAVKG